MAKKKLSPIEQIIHNQFTRYGGNAKEWTRKCAVLLPKVEKYQIWRKRGCKSIYEYAAKVAGMNHEQAREALRVINRIKDKPELMAIAEKKGINAVRPVATIATKETAGFWAGIVEKSSARAVEALVREKRKEDLTWKGRHVKTSQPENGQVDGDATKLMLELPERLARRLDRVSKRKDFARLMEKFIEGIEKEEESRKPEPVRTESRHVPAEIDQFSRERTGDKCAFPGCTKPIHQLHHTQRWALEHIHDPDRLWGLCQAHNEIAHRGLIENEEGRPETWRLRSEEEMAFVEQVGPALWTAKTFVDRRVRAFQAAATVG